MEALRGLAAIMAEYAKAREQREEAEKKAKDYKALEDALKEQIVQSLSNQNMSSTRVDGVGRVVLRKTRRYDIADRDLFARAILQNMVDNGKAGRSLSDSLLVQWRPAKTVLDELAESGEWSEEVLASKGLTVVSGMDITFTREKRS